MERPTVTEQLRRISEKLDRLRARDTAFDTFGSKSHRFELCPTLSEEVVSAWERHHGVTLPDGYRKFLLQLGDGGAGPDYGLFPLERATKESTAFRNDPAGLFPFTAAHAAHILATRRDEDRYHAEDLPRSLPGVLCVNHAGCDHYYFLVLTGELRGTMWYGSGGWCPCSDGGGKLYTFLDWYEAWLDRHLTPGVLPDGDTVLDHPEDVTGLNFIGRGLTELPPAVARMTRLERLELMRNELRELPEWIGDLSHLRHFSVFGNKLDSLPEAIGRLERLETLSVSYNSLTRLPDPVGRLRNLTFFQCCGTGLTELPRSLGGMASLATLNLANNKLTALPDSIGELSRLRGLDVGRNQLVRLPDSIGGLLELRELSLGSNGLTELPDSIGELPRLWTLDVFRNALRRIPPAVCHLPRLKRLYLGCNPDLDVADSLRVLAAAPALCHLNLSGLRLSELPAGLAALAGLESLDLSFNAFDRAPEVLREMPNLRHLTMKHNPLPEPEQKCLREWLPQTRCWFR